MVSPSRLDLDLDPGLLLRRVARRGLAQDLGEAVGVAEFGEPSGAFGLAAGDQVMQLAGFDLGDVFVIGHAAIDDDGAAFGQADARLEQVEHGGQRGAVLGVAGKDLMGDREAVAIDDEADHHLLAVRAVVARIAALGFAVGGGVALEIGRGQVVEVDRAVEVEQAALALDQRGLDGGAMRVELVEDAVERVLGQGIEVGAEDIGQGGAADPRRHGMLGGGFDQPVEDHRAGELAGARWRSRRRSGCRPDRGGSRIDSRPRPSPRLWTGPASRCCSVVTRRGSTAM